MKIWKKYGPLADPKTKIPLNENSLHYCSTDGCPVEFKYKQKLWSIWNRATHSKRKEDVANNKVCQIHFKVFVRKFKHSRHITRWYRPDFNAFEECTEPIEDEKITSMVFPPDSVLSEVVDAIAIVISEEDEEDIVQPN